MFNTADFWWGYAFGWINRPARNWGYPEVSRGVGGYADSGYTDM